MSGASDDQVRNGECAKTIEWIARVTLKGKLTQSGASKEATVSTMARHLQSLLDESLL